MKSIANFSLCLPATAFLVLLTACGSGGGNKSTPSSANSSSSTSSSGSTKPIPTTNKVSVHVDGLVGKLALSNGVDLLDITSNGDAQFAKDVEVGISYNVQIISQPENQICTVKNGRKVMVTASLPVEISCSNGFGVGLDVVKPKDFGLKNLQVVSNYQRLGGANDAALTLDSKIKTSQNSFIALKNSNEEKTYFLSYVYDAEQTRIKLDADHTALALLIMEPIITDSLAAHKLTVADFYDLIAPVNAQKTRQLDGDLKKLSDEIAHQADKNVDLFSAPSSVGALLEKALIMAIDKVANLPVAVNSSTAALAAAETGVDFKVETLSDTKITLTINNQRSRAVAITGLTGQVSPSILDALGSTKIEQTIEAGKFYNLNIAVDGPGKLGTLKSAAAAFQAAFIRSGLVDYYLPNLVYFSGGKDLSASLPVDCLSASDFKNLNVVATGAWSLIQTALEQDIYYKSYHTLADRYRAYWLDGTNMDGLLACSSLGLSGLTSAEKLNAKGHLTSLFIGFNKLREPNSMKEDLFRTAKQSMLVNAVVNSAAQSTWAYTNAFTIDIKAPAKIDDEAEAEFSAHCLDTAKKEISCSLSWTLEDATLTGGSVKYLFKKATSQIVNLVATDPSGVQVSQSITISVQRKSAGIGLSKKESTVALDTSKPLDFDKVFVGTKLPELLVIRNTGNLPLVISSVLDGVAFTSTLTNATIAVGAELEFEIKFSPMTAQMYTGNLSITTNDKLMANVQLALTGTGTAVVPVGKYEVIENQISREEAVAVTNQTAISGDENFAQVELFGQSSGVFPKISFRLLHFSGAGSYSLGDVDTDRDGIADESCLALYAAAKDYTQQYCTSSSASASTGSLVVTEVSAELYQIDYDFLAVNCLVPSGGMSCTKKVIQLRGSTKVEKSVLLPLNPSSNH